MMIRAGWMMTEYKIQMLMKAMKLDADSERE